MTSFRLLMLLIAAGCAAAGLLLLKLLQKKAGIVLSPLRKLLFLIGLLLTLDTVIVLRLSNFNLGVILPSVMGVPAMALALFLPKMKKGFLLWLKRILFFGYALALSLFLLCGVLMLRAARQGQDREADAVIVLGAAVHGDRVTWVLSNRLDAALGYLESHPGAVAVVSGGQGSGETVTEASAMAKYLLDRGVAPERVLLEERAESTVENFAFSRDVIRDALGEDARIAFVTTGFHVYRAGAVARRMGMEVFGIPAEDVWYLAFNNFLRESVGICVYTLRGDI